MALTVKALLSPGDLLNFGHFRVGGLIREGTFHKVK